MHTHSVLNYFHAVSLGNCQHLIQEPNLGESCSLTPFETWRLQLTFLTDENVFLGLLELSQHNTPPSVYSCLKDFNIFNNKQKFWIAKLHSICIYFLKAIKRRMEGAKMFHIHSCSFGRKSRSLFDPRGTYWVIVNIIRPVLLQV